MGVRSHRTIPMFVPSLNKLHKTGDLQEKMVPNPYAVRPLHRNLFVFLGKLIGLVLRMKYTISVDLSPVVWKHLVGERYVTSHKLLVTHLMLPHI